MNPLWLTCGLPETLDVELALREHSDLELLVAGRAAEPAEAHLNSNEATERAVDGGHSRPSKSDLYAFHL